MKFPQLNIPFSPLKIKEQDGIVKVYDHLRDKLVALTPEEYVRQQFTAWLHSAFNYPQSLMANEIGITVNGMKKRCDSVVFNKDGTPLLIVEYKAPDVRITQDTFDQIVRYNMVLKAQYLIVSNGLSHYCCVIDYSSNTYHFIPAIPDYRDLNSAFSAN